VDAVILSAALDTNGQNARYVRASEKWGTDEGILKALAIGNYDPASVVGRFAAASWKTDSIRIRSVHRATHIYQQMPADIEWTRANERLVLELALEADVLHLNNSAAPLRKLRDSRIRGKPKLLHHHGSLFRTNPHYGLQSAKLNNAVQCVSTVDLMRVAPDVLHWAPTAYDVDALQAFRQEHRGDDGHGVRIVQTPTDGPGGPYKSTELLQITVENLRAQGLEVELVIATNLPWIEAMKIKATADIYFDQVKLGYGCNAVEAWGMGIPVIAGADPWTLAKMREVFGTDQLPFYVATEETIGEAIITRANSKRLRTTYANRGLHHVRKFHDEKPALLRLVQLYRMAIEEGAPEFSVTLPSARFQAKVPALRIGAKQILFDPVYESTNPHITRKLRVMAIRQPKYGIEEVVDAA
jgi:hypothetical protein